jgi:diguanylate cyclase (GGDEF)-like protein
VDDFKNFNDVHGHVAGDQILENIALLIKQGVRSEDIPSRFGGEEFTVLLPNTDKDTVWTVAERLRASVSDMKVSRISTLPPVTISLGVYTFGKEADISATEIIDRADMALYQSKKNGKNRTTLWDSGFDSGH